MRRRRSTHRVKEGRRRSRRVPAIVAILLLLALGAGALFYVARARQTESVSATALRTSVGGVPFSRLSTTDEFRSGYRDTGHGPMKPQVRHFEIVELNSATITQLETLPGITADYAKKIVAGRPYRSMKDVERTGIPHEIVDQISPPAVIRVVDGGPLATPAPRPMPPPASR